MKMIIVVMKTSNWFYAKMEDKTSGNYITPNEAIDECVYRNFTSDKYDSIEIQRPYLDGEIREEAKAIIVKKNWLPLNTSSIVWLSKNNPAIVPDEVFKHLKTRIENRFAQCRSLAYAEEVLLDAVIAARKEGWKPE